RQTTQNKKFPCSNCYDIGIIDALKQGLTRPIPIPDIFKHHAGEDANCPLIKVISRYLLNQDGLEERQQSGHLDILPGLPNTTLGIRSSSKGYVGMLQLRKIRHRIPVLSRILSSSLPQIADTAFLRRALHECRLLHVECNKWYKEDLPRWYLRNKILLVDVKKMCLVESDTSAHYVALSYRWNVDPESILRTLRKNLIHLMVPSELERRVSEIPDGPGCNTYYKKDALNSFMG
ncbi:hypothetical protein K458DRAFT_465983, partial [Lentithecium fluviatile CBS 122367]